VADGLLWHSGAFFFAVWLGFLFVKRKARAEELENAIVGLLTWPAKRGAPPLALVRRALRFCEEECADVLGTVMSFATPPASEAAMAVAALISGLQELKQGGARPSFIAGSLKASRAVWTSGTWTYEEKGVNESHQK
jgi:hypothetical protein